jgi:phage terminase small subunit
MTQRAPDALKALRGTVRPDRTVASVSSLLPKMDVVPSPPDWMTDPAAVREWSELAPQLVACGVLRVTMVSSLAHLCQLHAALLAGYRSGEEPKAALFTAYTRLAGLFGLTAVDARRLHKDEPRKPSKYGDLRK